MAVYDLREVARMNDRNFTGETDDKMTSEERVLLCKQQLKTMKEIVEKGTFLRIDFSSIERRKYANPATRDTQLYLNDAVWITDRGSVKVPSIYLMKDTDNPNSNFTLMKLIKGESLAAELQGHFLSEIEMCSSRVY